MSSSTDNSLLFQPLKLNDSFTLSHRVILAPMTRFRADADHVPREASEEYYSQRTSVKGTLSFTETAIIAEEAAGFPHMPGVWTDEQVAGWKKIVSRIHSQGSAIYLQIGALGRNGVPDFLANKRNGPHYLVGAGDVPGTMGGVESPKPRPLTKEEIKKYVKLYQEAARKGVHEAGFDGIEIHSCHDDLIEQFLSSSSNNRTDEYGGSIENRSKFFFEVLDTVIEAIGIERTGLRFAPFSTLAGPHDPDPYPLYTHLITQLRLHYPSISHIHMVEPRLAGDSERPEDQGGKDSLVPFYEAWTKYRKADAKGGLFIVAGGYDGAKAREAVDKIYNKGENKTAVAIGRDFLANPDLPLRVKYGVQLNKYNRDTFYLPGAENTVGYTDYPFSKEVEGKTI